jgi:uracil-DNA glycosylase
MRVSECLRCKDFPCKNVNKSSYVIPEIDVNPSKVEMVMISESAPKDLSDYYYASGAPLFEQTTVQAFKDAGLEVDSINDLLNRGIYFTTAIKCGKIGYSIKATEIKECSEILEKELDLFPGIKVIMLMGDVPIKALNYISRRRFGKKAIPAGSTYKIRKQNYSYDGKRVFPSYLQAGPAFFIEKSKRRMIKEDIKNALEVLKS